MCGATTWILLDGMSTLQALEGGLQALAFSCDRCGFIRWHRKDKVDAGADESRDKAESFFGEIKDKVEDVVKKITGH